MKKLFLISVLLVFCHSFVISQGCLPGGITFSTQAQIDSFQVNYPGCTNIEGGVTINGDSISNLYGLGLVTHIGGDLYIGGGYPGPPYHESNPLLFSLAGLEDLTFIGGSLTFYNSGCLNSIAALGHLSDRRASCRERV